MCSDELDLLGHMLVYDSVIWQCYMQALDPSFKDHTSSAA